MRNEVVIAFFFMANFERCTEGSLAALKTCVFGNENSVFTFANRQRMHRFGCNHNINSVASFDKTFFFFSKLTAVFSVSMKF